VPMRERARSASGPGRVAASTTARTTGRTPAAVNATAAASCPACHASSLLSVEGMRMPTRTFLGKRPRAAKRPTENTIAPLSPNLSALSTRTRLAIPVRMTAGAGRHAKGAAGG